MGISMYSANATKEISGRRSAGPIKKLHQAAVSSDRQARSQPTPKYPMAKPIYTTHHGMTDILPEEAGKWQVLEDLIRQEARKFHFEEIRTPILEQTELIVRGVGQ